MSDKPFVIGIGEVLWDVFEDEKHIGGAPLNFVYHTLQLGCDSHIISSVGEDPIGDELFDRLNELGIDASYISRSDKYPTGKVNVSLDSNGVPTYDIQEGVAWDNITMDQSLKAAAQRADAICFGSLAQRGDKSRRTIKTLLDATSECCLKIFDINLRQHFFSEKIVVESLQRSDVLKINSDELQIISKMFGYSVDQAIKMVMKDFSIRLVACTLGEEGSVLVTENEISQLRPPSIKIVDTVGAGDAFTAALTYGLLSDLPLSEIHRNANELAAFICTCSGAMPKMK